MSKYDKTIEVNRVVAAVVCFILAACSLFMVVYGFSVGGAFNNGVAASCILVTVVTVGFGIYFCNEL